MAEVWMGAHPSYPSVIRCGDRDVGLDAHIASDPETSLGRPVIERFGARLPFLFKILAAARPLSIQAHPSKLQAEQGFARENAAGLDLASSERNYRDDNHKPELICAIRTFWGLRGFRPVNRIRDEFGLLSTRGIEPPRSESDLAPFFASLLRLGADDRRALTDTAVSAADRRRPGFETRLPDPADPEARYYWVKRIAREFPGDIGICAPLVLNVFSLPPGTATYQPAGVLHAYLEGVGVELMANSDNVLRGGLTPKHIDIDELLSVGVFRSEIEVMLSPRRGDFEETDSVAAYQTPFDEFELVAVSVKSEVKLPGDRPQIALCHSGSIAISGQDGSRLTCGPGTSVFIEAAEPAPTLTGDGTAYVARVGTDENTR
jgi:mannose-6-phosphate isomerase